MFSKKNIFFSNQKSFINVESRLASIMNNMINPFLVGLALTDLPKSGGVRGNPPACWFLWLCLPVAHDGKIDYCKICAG